MISRLKRIATVLLAVLSFSGAAVPGQTHDTKRASQGTARNTPATDPRFDPATMSDSEKACLNRINTFPTTHREVVDGVRICRHFAHDDKSGVGNYLFAYYSLMVYDPDPIFHDQGVKMMTKVVKQAQEAKDTFILQHACGALHSYNRLGDYLCPGDHVDYGPPPPSTFDPQKELERQRLLDESTHHPYPMAPR